MRISEDVGRASLVHGHFGSKPCPVCPSLNPPTPPVMIWQAPTYTVIPCKNLTYCLSALSLFGIRMHMAWAV